MRNLKLNEDAGSEGCVDRDFLAKQTPGFSGADIANVCNEAARVRKKSNGRISSTLSTALWEDWRNEPKC